MNLFINYRILAFYAPPATPAAAAPTHRQGPQQRHAGLHPAHRSPIEQDPKFKKIQRRVGQFDRLRRRREGNWLLE